MIRHFVNVPLKILKGSSILKWLYVLGADSITFPNDKSIF